MISECYDVLLQCERNITILILEGLPDIFCMGADLSQIESLSASSLYDLWYKLATGPYITIAHVHGKANAGGIGFVAACDMVIAGANASFSLSELLLGVLPACVMPFLIGKVGLHRARYLALTTRPVMVQTACEWGMVDAYAANDGALLHTHLLRLKNLSKTAISAFKSYTKDLYDLKAVRQMAVTTSEKAFRDDDNRSNIDRYVKTGLLPWQH